MDAASAEGANDMTGPFATFESMGKRVVCYLQPDCEVADVEALADDVRESCSDCCTEADLEAALEAVAARHNLRARPVVPSDPVERIVSFGFIPPFR